MTSRPAPTAYSAVVGGHEQHVGDGRVRDAGQLPAQDAVRRPRAAWWAAPGAQVQADGQRADRPPGRQPAEQSVVASQASSASVATTALVR